MRKTGLFSFLIFILVPVVTMAQRSPAIEEYISEYKDMAISEMLRTGVPASIKLAQGIHETSAGESELVRKSNNHFGIKCKSNWSGESVSHDDDARGECFRKYEKAEDSYRDHSDFLKNSGRYAFLFGLDPTDYQDWAKGLKKAGYATNPRYPQIIIKLIEDYNLNDYTLIALGKKNEEPILMQNDAIVSPGLVPAAEADAVASQAVTPSAVQYPMGEFRINDTRVVFVAKGTSYLIVAREHDISLSRLFDFNDMERQEVAANDQLIYLQRKRKTGNSEFHIVQPGETLFDIAQAEAIRLESLLKYNLLGSNEQPAIGEKLFLKTKATTAPRLTLKTDYSIYDGKSVIRK